MSELNRIVKVRPAFDRRDPDPKKNYGIHGAELAFYLIGKEGAIQFVIYTNWNLPHVQAELDSKVSRGADLCLIKPMAADIGYHSKVPQYERQTSMGHCDLIGCECYYDGSTLQAEEVFKIMVEEGSDALWQEMERRYHDQFSEPPK